jgi:hypothetical protein
MNNPDRLPGISLHLDTGRAPERPEDATIYGDWGGYNPVDAAPDPNGPAWTPSRHTRLLADITNDGSADIVAFGEDGVRTALATGDGRFASETFAFANFGAAQGWDPSKHLRLAADINNDGRADIVAFGDDGVWTSLATPAGFTSFHFVLQDFGFNQGWRVDRHVRLLADINNDGMADIVAFGEAGVMTALATGDGGFTPGQFLPDFGYDQGWRVDSHVRLLADINNDGRADIVGFGDAGVWTALSTGNGDFGSQQFALESFGSHSYIPQPPEQVWQEQMSPGRHGIFHYVMGYGSGGGACGGGSIACGFNLNSANGGAHEFGHTLGLDHNGPYSVTNEPNCKPNYPSLMNYAYYQSGYQQFSDGRNFPNFNNHSLQETAAVDPSNQALLSSLETYFSYKVDHVLGSIDWNRDGQFAAADTNVRAYANFKPGGSCEFTRQSERSTGLKSTHSPAILRFYNTIWVFAINTEGRLAYTYAVPGWNCSSTNIDDCPNAQFPPAVIHDLGPLEAIDAKTMLVNGREVIILVGLRPDGTLLETYLSLDNGLMVWGSVFDIPGTLAAGELSLANNFAKSSLALAYKGLDNIVRIRFRSAQGWSPEQQLKAGGQPITVHPNSSPAIAYAALPVGGITVGEHLIGAFVDSNGYIQLYTPQLLPARWGRINIPYDSMYAPQGRPAMGWTGGPGGVIVGENGPAAAAQPMTYGRFYILYLHYQPPAPIYHSPTNPMRWVMSYVDRSTGTLRIGLESDFDNTWAYAYGMSLLTPSDSGALRAAITSAVLPNHGTTPLDEVFFRPHADGISDLVYYNYDDWKTLAHDACTVLVKYQSPGPTKCALP